MKQCLAPSRKQDMIKFALIWSAVPLCAGAVVLTAESPETGNRMNRRDEHACDHLPRSLHEENGGETIFFFI